MYKKYPKPLFFNPSCRVYLEGGEVIDCNIETPEPPLVIAVAADGRQWIVQPEDSRPPEVIGVEHL